MHSHVLKVKIRLRQHLVASASFFGTASTRKVIVKGCDLVILKNVKECIFSKETGVSSVC